MIAGRLPTKSVTDQSNMSRESVMLNFIHAVQRLTITVWDSIIKINVGI